MTATITLTAGVGELPPIRNSPACLEALLQQVHPYVLNSARCLFPHPEEAEEAVQEVTLRVLCRNIYWSSASHLHRYLRRALERYYVDMRRQRQSARMFVALGDAQSSEDAVDDTACRSRERHTDGCLPLSPHLPEHSVMSQEVLNIGLSLMSPLEVDAYLSYEGLGEDSRSLAARQSSTANYVNYRVNQARRILRAVWEYYEAGYSEAQILDMMQALPVRRLR